MKTLFLWTAVLFASVAFEFIDGQNKPLIANKVKKRWMIRYRMLFLGAMQDDCLKDGTQCPHGFGLDLWITTNGSSGYLVSNGGQSSKANGFYVRKPISGEYEIGVALEENLWRQFVYLKPDKSVHLGFTWDRQGGLKIYVDGLIAGQQRQAEQRDFSNLGLDPTSTVNYLIANGDSSRFYDFFDNNMKAKPGTDSGEVLNMTYYYANSEEVVRLMAKDVDSRILVGCYDNVPNNFELAPVVMPSDPSKSNESYSYYLCRNGCAGAGGAWVPRAALVDTSGDCYCSSDVDPSNQVECSDSTLRALWTTVALEDPVWKPVFEVEIIDPKPVYTVGDEVALEIFGILDHVTFQFDFGDGTIQVPTRDPIASHYYSSPGTYVVKLIMELSNRAYYNESLLSFTVIPAHTPKPPADFEIVSSEINSHDGSMYVLVAASGEDDFKCRFSVISTTAKIKLNDGSDPSAFVFEAPEELTRTELGLVITSIKPGAYQLNAECSNDYGDLEKSKEFIVPYSEDISQLISRNTDVISVAAKFFGKLEKPAQALVKETSKVITIAVRNQTTILLRNLTSGLKLGNNTIEITTSNGLKFCTIHVTVFMPAGSGNIKVESPIQPHPTGYPVKYVVTIDAGEQIAGSIDIGDGSAPEEVPTFDHICPCEVSGEYTYTAEGEYKIKAMLKSQLGGDPFEVESNSFQVSEPVIDKAKVVMTPEDGRIYADDPMEFEIIVEQGFSLGGTIDFANGKVEKFKFENLICSKTSPCIKRYTTTYTIPNTENIVKVTLKGDYSDNTKILHPRVLVLTQPVGDVRMEIIDPPDMRYLPGDTVTFKLSVDSGESAQANVMFGDGNPSVPVRFNQNTCPCSKVIRRKFEKVGNFRVIANVSNIAGAITSAPIFVEFTQEEIHGTYLRLPEGANIHLKLGQGFTFVTGAEGGEQVSVSIDFGDQSEPFSTELFNAARKACPCEERKMYTFKDPGFYTVTATFSNVITTKTEHILVTVDVELASVKVEASSERVYSILADDVTFHVSVGTDSSDSNRKIPVQVECLIEGETYSKFVGDLVPATQKVDFSHVFKTFSAFPIVCTARNNITEVESDSSTVVRVGIPMSRLWVYPQRTRVATNEPMPISIVLMQGSGVEFRAEFRSVETGEIAATANADQHHLNLQLTEMEVPIPEPGIYSFKVFAENAYGNLVAESCQTVEVVQADLNSNCTEFSVSQPEEAFEFFRSWGGDVVIDIELNCQRNVVVSAQFFEFTGRRDAPLLVPVDNEVCSSSNRLEVIGNKSSVSFHVPELRFYIGTYFAKVEVTLDGYSSNLFSTFQISFNIISSPLVAKFLSNEEELMLTQPLIIGFSDSGDPDVGLEDSEGMRFDIYCSKDEQSPVNMTFDELEEQSEMVDENPTYMTRILDFNNSCEWANRSLELKIGFRQITFISDDTLETNVPYYFYLIVQKIGKDMPGRDWMSAIVTTGNVSTDAVIDRIEDLLRSGDKNGALTAINAVSQVLNKQGNSSGSVNNRAKARERILGILDNVSSALDTFNQLQNTGTALNSITQSREEVTEDAKMRASNALSNVGNDTKRFATQPINAITDVAGSVVDAVGNVLPTREEQDSEKSLFEGRLPLVDGEVINRTIFATISPSTPYLPSLVTVLPTSVMTTLMEMVNETAGVSGGIKRNRRAADDNEEGTTPAALISTTLSMPAETVTWATVRYLVETMDPAYNASLNSTSRDSVNETAEVSALKDALAALTTNDGPGSRTTLRCMECGLPPSFSIEKEIELLSRDGSFFTKREIILIEACGLYRRLDLRCLFYYEDPSELRQLYRSCREEEAEILAAKRKRDREISMKTVGSIDDVSGVLMSKQESGGPEIKIENPQLSLKLAKVGGPNSTNTAVGSEAGGFKIPEGTMGNASSGNGSLGMKFMASAANPYGFTDSADRIKSGVISLEMANPDGSPMNISNVTEPFDIRSKSNPILAPPMTNFSIFAPIAAVGELPMNYHRFDLDINDSSIHIVVRLVDDLTQVQVYIGYRFFPNVTHYNFTQMIPLSDDNATVKEAKDAQSADELRYTVFPPTELTRLNGSYYIGIKVIGAKLEIPYEEKNYTYAMRIFTSGCRFWDKETEEWSTGGCSVGPMTTIYETQCLCNHLTSFGSDFMATPNFIDFNNVWSKFDAKNATVYSILIVFIALYLILAVVCHRMDKLDISRWQPLQLQDNLPTDRYYYQVSIYTGWRAQSETNSKVRMIVVGARGDTGVRCLQPTRQNKSFVFAHGSITHFVLSTEQPLGQLSYLRIWHDNSGKGRYRSWFLNQIQISDLQSERKYYFLVDRWLGVDHDDGSVERVVPVASLHDLITFKYLFQSDLRRRFSEDHIFWSVASRPTRSLFTRVQRLTVCLSMILTTMLANAMFFENEPPQPEEDVDEYGAHSTTARNTIHLGPLKFSLRDLWISVLSSLVVVPVHAIAIFIFTNRAPSPNTARVGQEGISTVTKRSPRWKPVDENILQTFEDSDELRNRRQGVRGFFNRMGSKFNATIGRKDAGDSYESEESKRHRKIFKKKVKKFLFPYWAVYIAYMMLATCVVVSVFFLLLYSMMWGIDKSNRWALAFTFSFINEFIFLEPLKIFAVVLVLSCIFKKHDTDKQELYQIDKTKEEVERWAVESKGSLTKDEFDEITKRRHSKPAELMPPDRASLAEARERRLHELEMENVIRDVIVYTFFVAICMLLAFTLRGHEAYTMHAEILNLVSENYQSILTPQDYWDWMNDVVLPALYPDNDWGGQCLGWREAQQLSDFANLRIGVPRLRQFRVSEESCTIEKRVGKVSQGRKCLTEYSFSNDDTAPYLPEWKALTPENVGIFGSGLENLTDFSDAPLLRDSPWIYQDAWKIKGVSYTANKFTYKGGGYIAEFKRTKRETIRVLRHLQEMHWIDERTRAVFFEFSTYNPNANLFTSPILVMEFLASGDTSARFDIKVFTVYDGVGAFQFIIWGLGIVFIIYIVAYARIEYKKMKSKGLKSYFSEYFNIITLAMLVFSFISSIMYFVRFAMARIAANALSGAGSEVFVNYGALAINAEIFMFFVGFAAFFTTLNFLKILNFNKRLAILGMVLKVGMRDIKPFGLVFVCTFFAFSQLYYFAVGTVLIQYSSIIASAETLMLASLGSFDFLLMRKASPILGPLAFMLFLVIVMLTMMGMFTVIIETAARIRKQLRQEHNQVSDYETMLFIWRKIKGLFGVYDD